MKYVKYILGILLIPFLLTAQKPTEFSTAISNFENYAECGLAKMFALRQSGVELTRPVLSGTELFVNKTHFRIHYTLSGIDAATTAYAESAGVAAESVWTRLTALGWYMAPPDGSNGGDTRYDIYIKYATDYSGVCNYESPYTSPFPDGYSSWVEIVYSGISYTRLRALIAHEYGHGCEMRYSLYEEPYWWFYENTSVFLEDIVFDDVNTLPGRLTGSTDDPLDNPQYPINRATGVYEYRGALWTHFLDEYYDTYTARTVRRIWELCGYHVGNYILKDIDSTLALYYSSNFAKALGHYAIWRYFSGTRDEGRHYEEGSTYPDAALLRTHTTYSATGTQGSANPSGPGGSNYIKFTNFGSNRVTLYFDGVDGYEWSAYVLGRYGTTSYEYRIQLEPSRDTGRITIPGWEYSEIVLIPIVTHWTGTANNLTYSYTVTLSSADGININSENSQSDVPYLQLNPNPAKKEVLIRYFLSQPSKGIMKIYNNSGRLINELTLLPEHNSVIWDRRDENGNKVADGIYFFQLSANNIFFNKKVLLCK
jgi:hypothetical protein